MDKNKIPIIILAILFIASCFIAFNFYNQSSKLLQEKQKLLAENESLDRKAQEYRSEVGTLRSERERLSSDYRRLQEALDKVEKERALLSEKYQNASANQELLIEEIKNLKKSGATAAEKGPSSTSAPMAVTTSDEYWQDLVQKKAELELNLQDLRNQSRDDALKVTELENKNQELQAQLDTLSRIKEELERKVNFNVRTIQIITKDLVREKEDRMAIMGQLDKLKNENVSLTRELRLTKKIKEDMQTSLLKTQDAKQILERKIEDMGSVLKEKSLEMSDLQRQLTATISSAEQVMPKESKAVELPPIVVKSQDKPSIPSTLLEGKVLAVNDRENFVIVDIGSSSGIKPADKFTVIRDARPVGSLEVVETRLDIAACDIRQAQDRIREGDIVRFNP